VAQRRVSSPVTALVYQEAPPALWSGHDDGSLRRWNLRLLPQQVHHLPGGHRVTALAWADGRLAAADSHGKLWLLESSSEDPPEPFASLPAYLRTLAFDDSGEHLFGGSWFRLYRWDLSTGAMRVLPTAHHGIITALQWNAPRRALFSISRQTDSSVLALDPDNGGTLTDFGQHDLCGADVAVSANGQVLATTSDDGSVRIWRLRSAPPSSTSAGSAHGSGSRP
jgi:WD40 repeat protein